MWLACLNMVFPAKSANPAEASREKQSCPKGTPATWWEMTTALHWTQHTPAHEHTRTHRAPSQFKPRKFNLCFTQYINCTVKESQGGPMMNTSCVLPSSSFSLSSGCYWSDLLLSQLEPWFMLPWPALTHHTQTQLSHARRRLSVHLSICLCLVPRSALRRLNLLTTKGLYVTIIIHIVIFAIGIVLLSALLENGCIHLPGELYYSFILQDIWQRQA